MAFVEADSYTTLARIQALVGRGAFYDGPTPAATAPKLQAVLDFMALRAKKITAKALELGVTISPTSKNDGSTLMGLADLANQFYAAGDVIFAHDAKGERPPDRSIALWAEASDAMDSLTVLLGSITTGVGVKSATSTGGITKADFTDTGARKEVDVSTLFNMGTLN